MPAARLGLAAALLLLAAAPSALAQTAGSVPAATACEDGRDLGHGVCVGAGLLADGVANLRGGVRRGAAALAQLTGAATLDLGEALAPDWDGWRLGISAAGIYGRQPSRTLVGSLAPVSNAEALSTLRLNALWAERDWDGVAALRLGQLAVDAEFTVAEAAGRLSNGTFGWPVALATSLPSGGAYPFAAPGGRLALGAPQEGTGLRLGVFAGDPAGRPGAGTDPQRHNRFGTTFSTSGGTFLILEAVTGAAPVDGQRPWVAKLGAWRQSGSRFASQRRDTAGLSLADPASDGVPRRVRDDQGFYGVSELTLWRDGPGRVAGFGRVFAQPGDRNLVSLQTDAGLAWNNAFGRNGETLSLGLSAARIGRDARRLDRDAALFGDARPPRDHEVVAEATYDVALRDGGLHLRPGLQWLLHPAARAPDDRVPGRPLKNALVAALRVQAAF